MSVEGQNVGNMLIGSHDDECPALAVNAAQLKDIVAVIDIGTI